MNTGNGCEQTSYGSMNAYKGKFANLFEVWKKYPNGGGMGWFIFVGAQYPALYLWDENKENWKLIFNTAGSDSLGFLPLEGGEMLGDIGFVDGKGIVNGLGNVILSAQNNQTALFDEQGRKGIKLSDSETWIAHRGVRLLESKNGGLVLRNLDGINIFEVDNEAGGTHLKIRDSGGNLVADLKSKEGTDQKRELFYGNGQAFIRWGNDSFIIYSPEGKMLLEANSYGDIKLKSRDGNPRITLRNSGAKIELHEPTKGKQAILGNQLVTLDQVSNLVYEFTTNFFKAVETYRYIVFDGVVGVGEVVPSSGKYAVLSVGVSGGYVLNAYTNGVSDGANILMENGNIVYVKNEGEGLSHSSYFFSNGEWELGTSNIDYPSIDRSKWWENTVPRLNSDGVMIPYKKISAQAKDYVRVRTYTSFQGRINCLVIPIVKPHIIDRRDAGSFTKEDFIPLRAEDRVQLHITEFWNETNEYSIDTEAKYTNGGYKNKQVIILYYNEEKGVIENKYMSLFHGLPATGKVRATIHDLIGRIFDIEFYREASGDLTAIVTDNLENTSTIGNLIYYPQSTVYLHEQNNNTYYATSQNTQNNLLLVSSEEGGLFIVNDGSNLKTLVVVTSDESKPVTFRIFSRQNNMIDNYDYVIEPNSIVTLIRNEWDSDYYYMNVQANDLKRNYFNNTVSL